MKKAFSYGRLLQVMDQRIQHALLNDAFSEQELDFFYRAVCSSEDHAPTKVLEFIASIGTLHLRVTGNGDLNFSTMDNMFLDVLNHFNETRAGSSTHVLQLRSMAENTMRVMVERRFDQSDVVREIWTHKRLGAATNMAGYCKYLLDSTLTSRKEPQDRIVSLFVKALEEDIARMRRSVLQMARKLSAAYVVESLRDFNAVGPATMTGVADEYFRQPLLPACLDVDLPTSVVQDLEFLASDVKENYIVGVVSITPNQRHILAEIIVPKPDVSFNLEEDNLEDAIALRCEELREILIGQLATNDKVETGKLKDRVVLAGWVVKNNHTAVSKNKYGLCIETVSDESKVSNNGSVRHPDGGDRSMLGLSHWESEPTFADGV